MNTLIGTLMVKEKHLTCDDKCFSNQYSENLFMAVDFKDDYLKDATLLWYCSHDRNMNKTVLMEYDPAAKRIKLPQEAFSKHGWIYISLRAIKGESVITSDQIGFLVSISANPDVQNIPKDDTWETIVRGMVDQLFENEFMSVYEDKMNDLSANADKLQKKAAEQQIAVGQSTAAAEQATQTANTAAANANEKAVAANDAAQAANKAKSDADTATGKANKAVSDANTAASNANTKAGEAATATSGAITAKNDANKAAANANEKAAAAVTATQGANTAKAAAETATKKADEITKQVQQKLNNGDFIGEKGTSYKNQGTWASGKAYKYDNKQIDTVSYSGAMYGCIKSHTSSTSITPANATYWVKMAAQGEPGPTVVKLDSETQNQLIMTKTRTANPSYVAVQFKTADGKVLAFEVPASQVIISDEVTLDTVLNGNSFYHSHTEEHLNLCNYAEWVAAGKPAMPTNFN